MCPLFFGPRRESIGGPIGQNLRNGSKFEIGSRMTINMGNLTSERVPYLAKWRVNDFFASNKARKLIFWHFSDTKFHEEYESAQKSQNFCPSPISPSVGKVHGRKCRKPPIFGQIRVSKGKIGQKMHFLAFPVAQNGQKRPKIASRFFAPAGNWTLGSGVREAKPDALPSWPLRHSLGNL